MANGTVVTRKGLQLIAKLVASETALTFTRVAIGTGKVPGGYDPGSMTGLNEYKMDGSIASHSASGDEASVVMQISSIGVETGFTITEAGLFATDPDEGEILYAYLDMSADPQYMYPENNAISKFIELTLVVKIGEVQSVTAVINPGSLITEEKFEAEKAETVHKSDIINSFSDTAGDHETVMGTVMGYQHDRDIKWLKGYAVTKEMISNQNVESTNLVPSAYLLYQLNKTLLQKCEDLLTKYNALNSDLKNMWSLSGNQTLIPNNSDMHTYLTPGNYYCASNTNAETLKNSPLKFAFTMKVYLSVGIGSQYLIQEYTKYDASERILVYYDGNRNIWTSYHVQLEKTV